MAGTKNTASHWVMWWKVDPDAIAKAVAAYRTLNPFKSPRGIAACCLLFTATITAAFHLAKAPEVGDLADAAVFLVLAVFVYLGHRWAMLLAMAWWTLGKLIFIFASLQTSRSAAGLLVANTLWWCAYMHVLWKAFQVEQARRKPSVEVAGVFD